MNITTLKKLPVNIDLLYINENDIQKLEQITEISIFDNMNNFHPNGLFSTTIFGKVGTEIRNRTFSYIDLKINILHPLIYYCIITLKSFYKEIAEGNTLAIFDNKTKSFIKSNLPEAQTGFNFFMQHISELVFEKNESDKRSFMIDLFNKAIKENKYLLRYALVLPAGLRDYTIDENGKPQEDEINTYYRKLLSQSNIIDVNVAKKSPEVYNNIAIGLQNTLLELFEYIKSLLEGKHKLILGKWLTRKIFNSTRNVASNAIEKASNINDHLRLGYNECYSGLHQYLRITVPKSIFEIKNKFIKNIFIENNIHAYLTNSKTLKREEVLNTHIQKDYDLWTTSDGIEKVIANMSNLDIRHLPITLNNNKHYIGLLYRDNKYFKFFQDINELPTGFDSNKVTPITLSEFLYISIYHLSGKIPGLVTRYPITGFGSIFPVFIKIVTTTESDILEELDYEWKPSGNIAHSFPKKNMDFFNTVSVHHSRFGALGLDLDGDTLSLTALLTEESMNEISSLLNSKEYYINNTGNLNFSSSTDVLNTVLSYMT